MRCTAPRPPCSQPRLSFPRAALCAPGDIAIAFRLNSEDVVVAAFPNTPSGSPQPGGFPSGEPSGAAAGAPSAAGTAAASNQHPGRGRVERVKRAARNPLFALTSAWSAVTEVEQKVEAAIRRQPELAAQHLVARNQDHTAPPPIDVEAGRAPATAEQLAALAEITAARGGQAPHACAPAIVRGPSSDVGPLTFGWKLIRGQGL